MTYSENTCCLARQSTNSILSVETNAEIPTTNHSFRKRTDTLAANYPEKNNLMIMKQNIKYSA